MGIYDDMTGAALNDPNQFNATNPQSQFNATNSPYNTPAPSGNSLMQAPAAAPSQPGYGFGNHPSGTSVSSLLQPYQDIANRMYSPYGAAFGSQNAWAQAHPQMARGISGALMAASNIHPQMTIGGNIQQVASGLLGVHQYNQQQDMMRNMLPYQMLQPQLAAQHTMAETENLQGEAAMRPAQQAYMLAHATQAEAQAARASQPHVKFQRVSVAGNDWVTYDDGTQEQISGEPEANPKFAPSGKQFTITPGSLLGAENQLPPGQEPNPVLAATMLGQLADYNARSAGAVRGQQNIQAQPQADKAAFIKSEEENLLKDIPAPTGSIDARSQAAWAGSGYKITQQQAYAQVQQEDTARKDEIERRTSDFPKWQTDPNGAAKQVPFRVWQAAQSAASKPASPAAPATPGSVPVPTWTNKPKPKPTQ